MWVVPYNPYLLAKFDCHLNVEVCCFIKAVKYLYKYVYKGHDRVCFSVKENSTCDMVNEIDMFQIARWISPPEATWRLYSFTISEMHPHVYSLQLHLPESQLVTFDDGDDLDALISNEALKRTMLTEFFKINKKDLKAKSLLYRQFPDHFVWNKHKKIWTKRQKHDVIGRIITSSPLEGERYYMRLLLNHVTGPTSFDDLKTVRGVQASTFREAALLHGLLDGDDNYETCLREAALYEMPSALRRLFATILVFCSPRDPRLLWEQFWGPMSEDYANDELHNHSSEVSTLQSINSILEPMGKSVSNYFHVDFQVDNDVFEKTTKLIFEEMELSVSNNDILAVNNLNTQQKYAYDQILHKVFMEEPAMFFIDGPSGTGKTYLYRALLASVRSKKLIALATTSSGVDAGILSGGRTAHSRFKIPLNLDDDSVCSVSKQSSLAELFKLSKLIIWDEAPMMHRRAIEVVDRMLQDVNDSSLPFGGKVVVTSSEKRLKKRCY